MRSAPPRALTGRLAMLDDLTAKEIYVLVQMLKTVDADAMTFNDNDELTFIKNLPETKTLLDKLALAIEREDVVQLIEERNK